MEFRFGHSKDVKSKHKTAIPASPIYRSIAELEADMPLHPIDIDKLHVSTYK